MNRILPLFLVAGCATTPSFPVYMKRQCRAAARNEDIPLAAALHCERFVGRVPADQLPRLLDVEEAAAEFVVRLEEMDESDLQRDNLIDALIESGAVAEEPDGTLLQVDNFD